MIHTLPLLFEDKPLFGLDIGHGKVRVMQLQANRHRPRLIGYGEATFDPSATTAGVIEKPEIVAEAIQNLFKHHLVGDITTRRVAMAVPIAHAFTRSIDVPQLNDKDLAEAVKNEAEQYIPAATDDLYIDYSRSGGTGSKTSVLIVAMPKKIVDSYLVLAQLINVEPVVMQTSSGAGAHLFTKDPQSDIPTLLVDFGSDSADITVYDGGPIVNGTVACGSELLTSVIADELKVTVKEATIIKAKYGLGFSKKQAQIEKALAPPLSLLLKDMRRTIRYYEEHAEGKQKIAQVIIAGGGANMPGLAEYLTSNLRIAVRSFDPTSFIDFGRLQPFNLTERMSFVTAAGLAAIEPDEVFA